LPLGAGGHFVRLNGRLYEALAARLERRPARDLYHSALQVEVPQGTFVIEQAPVHDWSGTDRGVVAEGDVMVDGSIRGGRLRPLGLWWTAVLGRESQHLRELAGSCVAIFGVWAWRNGWTRVSGRDRAPRAPARGGCESSAGRACGRSSARPWCARARAP
jgi:hypothetical protein